MALPCAILPIKVTSLKSYNLMKRYLLYRISGSHVAEFLSPESWAITTYLFIIWMSSSWFVYYFFHIVLYFLFFNLLYFRCSSYALQTTCPINRDDGYKKYEKSPKAQVLVPAPPLFNSEVLVITLSHCLFKLEWGVSQMPSLFEAMIWSTWTKYMALVHLQRQKHFRKYFTKIYLV